LATGASSAPAATGHAADRRRLVTAGILIGKGMGGFVDGIVLHQLLQLHHMLSARREPTSVVNLQVNMVWDGIFFAITWVATALGVYLLFRVGQRPGGAPLSGRAFAGALLVGWGLFNLIEGLIDHHLLHVHHVVERLGVSAYDYAFLASGLILIAAGWAIIRSDRGAIT
jgi:uncharacterized membrane protein